MEFPRITVVGGFTGMAGKSSSFRHEFFDRVINWTEIVLANSEVVIAPKPETLDSFHASPKPSEHSGSNLFQS